MASFYQVLAGITLLARLAAASECSLCGSHIDIPTFGKDGTSCSDLLNNVGGLDSSSGGCKKNQLIAFQAGCCGDDKVPSDACSLCPDGNLFGTGIAVPGAPGRRELTCGDLPSEASFLEYFTAPGECQDTFLQRSAAWCQCTGTSVECNLCPDGSSPPNPELTEKVLYGWNCASFEFVTALLSKAECPLAPQILEFDAAAFCCPGVKPAVQLCSFCPGTQVVGDPDKIITTSYGDLTCGEIEKSLSLIPTNASCLFSLEQFDPQLCCINGNSKAQTTQYVFPFLLMVGSLTMLAASW